MIFSEMATALATGEPVEPGRSFVVLHNIFLNKTQVKGQSRGFWFLSVGHIRRGLQHIQHVAMIQVQIHDTET